MRGRSRPPRPLSSVHRASPLTLGGGGGGGEGVPLPVRLQQLGNAGAGRRRGVVGPAVLGDEDGRPRFGDGLPASQQVGGVQGIGLVGVLVDGDGQLVGVEAQQGQQFGRRGGVPGFGLRRPRRPAEEADAPAVGQGPATKLQGVAGQPLVRLLAWLVGELGPDAMGRQLLGPARHVPVVHAVGVGHRVGVVVGHVHAVRLAGGRVAGAAEVHDGLGLQRRAGDELPDVVAVAGAVDGHDDRRDAGGDERLVEEIDDAVGLGRFRGLESNGCFHSGFLDCRFGPGPFLRQLHRSLGLRVIGDVDEDVPQLALVGLVQDRLVEVVPPRLALVDFDAVLLRPAAENRVDDVGIDEDAGRHLVNVGVQLLEGGQGAVGHLQRARLEGGGALALLLHLDAEVGHAAGDGQRVLARELGFQVVLQPLELGDGLHPGVGREPDRTGHSATCSMKS